MKKLMVAILAFAMLAASPAHAWYRGYGYGGWGYGRPAYGYGGWGYRPYYGGYGWNNGAALGIAAGAALLGGALAAGAYSQQRYYGYGAQCPVYDGWGNFLGYRYC